MKPVTAGVISWSRWVMVAIVCPLLWVVCLLGGSDGTAPEGPFVYQPAYCLDEVLRGPAQAYRPQPGDIFLITDRLLFWKVTFSLALSGHPHHAAMVVARPDGRLALVEAGPHDTTHVELLDLLPDLQSYEQEGRVWVRRRRTPLTPEQSAQLTAFALRQEGKPFALVRLGGQLTPFRSRGPLRTRFVGKPHGERRSYICSELVLELCVAADLLDPTTTRPAATYPRDLFFDRSPNPYLNKTLDLSPGWYPPARWSSFER